MFPVKCVFYPPFVTPSPPPSFYHSAFSLFLCLFLCMPLFPTPLLSLTPRLPKTALRTSIPPGGSCGSMFPESSRDLTGTCWNKWQRETLQARHQIRRGAQIKESGKLWRSAAPPQWCSNVAFGCHATMAAATHNMHTCLSVCQRSYLKLYGTGDIL